MSKIADQIYLRHDQYRDASNLDARVRLHLLYSTNKYGWNPWLFEHCTIPAKARVLELGCGPGYLWRDNHQRIPTSWDITLSDFSVGMLQQARDNLSEQANRFRFEIIDAQSIPFEDSQFDAVIANFVLHHVPDRAQALSEIQRVLRPGGHLFAATNGRRDMPELLDMLQRFDPQADFGWGLQAHDLFGLEDGDALTHYFVRVNIHRYADALVVTEAAPLVDYVLSTTVSAVVASHRPKLHQFVEQELAHGPIHISKDAGLFEALRP